MCVYIHIYTGELASVQQSRYCRRLYERDYAEGERRLSSPFAEAREYRADCALGSFSLLIRESCSSADAKDERLALPFARYAREICFAISVQMPRARSERSDNIKACVL